MPAEPATLAARLRAWRPVLIVAGVLLAAGLVAIPLGGWDTVQLQSRVVPSHPVGEAFAGHRVATSIDGVYLTDDPPDEYTEREPGMTYLVVVTTMENVTKEPELPIWSSDFHPFTIPGVIELGEPLGWDDYEVFLERDLTSNPWLLPGVPEELRVYFPVRTTAFAVGDEIAVGITDADPEEADLYVGTRWVDPHVAVEVAVTIGAAP